MVMEDWQYKSPLRKLLRFFKRSRDGWKRKCKQAKAKAKRLANRVRWLQKSRQHWKELAKERQREFQRIRRHLEVQKDAAY